MSNPKELASRLRRAIHEESALIAPRTSNLIEVCRGVAEELEGGPTGPGDGGEIRAVPCIVCDRVLLNLDERGGNQPLHGVEFTTNGHYGCTLFDPMDGTRLAINICDPCLLARRDAGKILILRVQSQRTTSTNYSGWK